MKKQMVFAVVVLGSAAALVGACAEAGAELDQVGQAVHSAAGVSVRGVAPTAHAGNFVASDDDQVCYELSALGYIDEVTGEMRGFKIDPPVAYNNGDVQTVISGDGRYLDWQSAEGVSVLGFIIKGGPTFHVYDYVGTGFDWDGELVSPAARNGRVPQISHYNVCYEITAPDGDQGCTPGYWRNHADRWFGVAPSDDFDRLFGVDLFSPNINLGTAVSSPQTYGVFAFHAVAALLNAYGGVPNADGTTVSYPYSVAEVIDMVQAAAASGDFDATKDAFAAANELGCPLSGTRAISVP
jgi:hypothetical protein